MKAVLSIVALLAAAAGAVPEARNWELRRSDDPNMEDLPLADFQVQDDRFGDKVFHGTPKDIYEEMKALKPELFLDEEVEPLLEERALEARQGTITCGWGDPVYSWNNCIEGITYLQRLGTAWCGVGNQPACARVSCSRGCGMFLCNRLNAHWRVSCIDIAKDVRDTYERCMGSLGAASGRREFGTHYIGVQRQSC